MNVRKIRILHTLLMTAALTACGGMGSKDNPSSKGLGGHLPPVQPFGTCDRKMQPAYNQCSEAVGSEYNDQAYLDILQDSCESTGGTYSTNNCDLTGSLGTCYIMIGQTNETRVTYYPSHYDADSARSECESMPGGNFVLAQ